MNKLKKINSVAVLLGLISYSTISAGSNNLSLSSNTNSQFSTQSKIKISGREYYRYDDMLVPVEKFSLLSQFDLNKNKWTDGNVFFQFSPEVSIENRQQFIKATEVWAKVAQLDFIERTEQSNYIYVENGSGNFATVGMAGGRQTLTMSNWGSLYVVVHELGHSLGMWHEQQRSDRDNYVEILTDNILDNQQHNFNLQNTTSYGGYDFLSIMQYSSNAWSKNGLTTIKPKKDFVAFTPHMGQRRFLSGGDQYSVAAHYGAKNISFADSDFKNYLVAHFDKNGDGEIDTLEAAQVETIQTPGNAKISSIDGIQYFRTLKTLDVSNEGLTDIPELPNHLVDINLSNNNIQVAQSSWILPPMINTLHMTGNPIDEYSCDDISFIESTIAGSFSYSPVQSGQNLVCDDRAKLVLFDGKTRYDLRSKGAQIYHIEVPAGVAQLKIETDNFDGQVGGEMNLYLAHGKQPESSEYDYISTNAGNSESIVVENPQAGIWYVLLQPVERSFEFVNLTAVLYDSNSSLNLLVNNKPISGLSGIESSTQIFAIDLSENATDLSFDISGGSGDADLYVKFEQEPTLSDYDCRPWKSGNNETCRITDVRAGRYYIMLHGYGRYSDLTLVGRFSESDEPVGGHQSHTNLEATAGSWLDFQIEIPDAMRSLIVTVAEGSGDADLYVKHGSQATSADYDCRPYLIGNDENCQINNPKNGVWYISLKAYSGFSKVNLEVEWKP